MKNAVVLPIEPMAKRLLVEELVIEEKTASGFILPDAEKPQRGQAKGVVAGVGDQVEINVETGDIVVFNRSGQATVSHLDKTYLIVNEGDILVKLDDEQQD